MRTLRTFALNRLSITNPNTRAHWLRNHYDQIIYFAHNKKSMHTKINQQIELSFQFHLYLFVFFFISFIDNDNEIRFFNHKHLSKFTKVNVYVHSHKYLILAIKTFKLFSINNLLIILYNQKDNKKVDYIFQ